MFCWARGWDFGGWGRDTIFDGSRLNESNIHSFNFFCLVESEEFEKDDKDDNKSDNGSHAPLPDYHEKESTSSMSDLEIDHDLTDSPGTLQELGKKYLLK